jgi:hypothetical protein
MRLNRREWAFGIGAEIAERLTLERLAAAVTIQLGNGHYMIPACHSRCEHHHAKRTSKLVVAAILPPIRLSPG